MPQVTNYMNLKGLGPFYKTRLAKLNIKNKRDIIDYFPYEYDDKTNLSKIKNLNDNEKGNFIAVIKAINARKSPRGRYFVINALLSDETGSIEAIWFNQAYLKQYLTKGRTYIFSGTVKSDAYGKKIQSPDFILATPKTLRQCQERKILPKYMLTPPLKNRRYREWVDHVLKNDHTIAREFLPDDTLFKFHLLSLKDAYPKIHFPKNFDELKEAKRRFAFNELLLVRLKQILLRKNMRKKNASPITTNLLSLKKFLSTLPYSLTIDQKKALWQIIKDMEKDKPMNRLLNGDVGSGKTIVAFASARSVAENHAQSVILVPTEVLALQHFENAVKIFAHKDATFSKDGIFHQTINIALLTSSKALQKIDNREEKTTKKKLKASIATGKIDLVIGTHAIIENDVCFKNLALAIIDEQHRFGVAQRNSILKKNASNFYPHLLSMTATPIPRTITLSLFGDLDVSFIREKPKERKKIATRIVREEQRVKAYDFITDKIKEGRQIFVICPLIEESDKLGVKSVLREYENLSQIFPSLNIDYLHGKMKADEKKKKLNAFSKNRIHILISTTVIEVGVDFPNATVMMIEGGERFGLAQLHQIRGRVGRSTHQSYCIVFADMKSMNAFRRLKYFEKVHDGFLLSEYDLNLRGGGEFYGKLQSGIPDFKFASLTDKKLIDEVVRAVDTILANDPNLKKNILLRDEMVRKLGEVHRE